MFPRLIRIVPGAFFSSPPSPVVTQNIHLFGGKGCKEGHKFVKKITKKDKKGDESFERGEYQIAIDSWWEAINADISLLAFVRPTLLKVVKAHLGLKQYDKAIEEARKHVGNEESVEGLHALGGAQLAGDMFEEAIRTYNRAHEIAVR
jgi:tetratricopeptide (TPR) repeat protein